MSGYRIDRWLLQCDQQLTVVGAVVYNSYGACLFTAQIPTHQWICRREEKRTEFYLRSGKSEAEVTNNRRMRSTYCTIEANYWQTWSIARPLCDSRDSCDTQLDSENCHRHVTSIVQARRLAVSAPFAGWVYVTGDWRDPWWRDCRQGYLTIGAFNSVSVGACVFGNKQAQHPGQAYTSMSGLQVVQFCLCQTSHAGNCSEVPAARRGGPAHLVPSPSNNALTSSR